MVGGLVSLGLGKDWIHLLGKDQSSGSEWA